MPSGYCGSCAAWTANRMGTVWVSGPEPISAFRSAKSLAIKELNARSRRCHDKHARWRRLIAYVDIICRLSEIAGSNIRLLRVG